MSLYCTLYLESGDGTGVSKLELERCWGLLDYLFRSDLSHNVSTTGFLTNDYEELSPEAHRISEGEISEISNWLSNTPNAALLDAFDPAAMLKSDCYDADLALQYPDEYLIKLEGMITALRAYLVNAAHDGDAIVRTIV